MKFWAIIKVIAGIIANLPFDANVTDAKVRGVVKKEVQKNEDQIQEMSTAVVGQALTPADIEQIISHVVGIVLIIVRSRSGDVGTTSDEEASNS